MSPRSPATLANPPSLRGLTPPARPVPPHSSPRATPMRTTTLGVLALLAAFALTARADDKDAKKALEQIRADMRKDLDGAQPVERRKLALQYAEKLVEHATRYSDDPSAVDAAVTVVT